MKRFLSLAAAAALVATGPCPGHAQDVRQHLLVSPEWLAEHLEDTSVQVLYVGTDRSAFERSRIPGALYVDLDALARERDGLPRQMPPLEEVAAALAAAGTREEGRVVVYGSPLLAARGFVALDALGHGERTALLDGGFPEWSRLGLPTARGPAAAEPGRLAPQPREKPVVVEADWVERHRERSGYALVDARPEAQYSGAEPGDGVERPGHIPGAGSLFWERLLVSTEVPTLRDPDALRALLSEAGVGPEDTVVAYCRSGLQGGFLYFTARHLGYPARLYDGSYLDWSRRTELPVQTSTGLR
jgi:thiosulfate/3-mercaptopyruvate sulfurtransferase